MEIVRKHRRPILVVLMLFALGAMTFGFLKRVGIDPIEMIAPARAE